MKKTFGWLVFTFALTLARTAPAGLPDCDPDPESEKLAEQVLLRAEKMKAAGQLGISDLYRIKTLAVDAQRCRLKEPAYCLARRELLFAEVGEQRELLARGRVAEGEMAESILRSRLSFRDACPNAAVPSTPLK